MFGKLSLGGCFLQPGSMMRRVHITLRLLAAVLASPVVAVYIAGAVLLHPIAAVRTRFRIALRLWMNVVDWVKGIPVGYTYWEQYEAAAMLDEIVVHHKD